MTPSVSIALIVNGENVQAQVEPRLHLADFLRDQLGLTGTHIGCEHGVCGACTVRIDGEIVRGCLTLAVQADGRSVETIEGLSDSGAIDDLQAAFRDRNALQCGYCTPAMLITAHDLLAHDPMPDRATIREYLSGNYCRCTGYHAIVDAVETARNRRPRPRGSEGMTDNATPSFCVVPGGRRPDRDPIPHQHAPWPVERLVDPGSDGRGDDEEAFGKTSR